MLRTRILSFTAGFAVTGAAIAQLAWKDLWSTHAAFALQVQDYYDALERRVERLETHISPPPTNSELPQPLERVTEDVVPKHVHHILKMVRCKLGLIVIALGSRRDCDNVASFNLTSSRI